MCFKRVHRTYRIQDEFVIRIQLRIHASNKLDKCVFKFVSAVAVQSHLALVFLNCVCKHDIVC